MATFPLQNATYQLDTHYVAHNAVRNFGAYAPANDGVTTDATKLQAAIDELPATGGTVLLDGAYAGATGYYVNTTITISDPNVTIAGSGLAKLVLGPSGKLSFTGNYGKLEGIYVDATACTQTISVYSTGTDFEMDRCRIYATNTDCTDVSRLQCIGDRPYVHDTLFDGHNVAVKYDSLDGGRFSRNTFTNGRTGFYSSECNELNVSDNRYLSAGARLEGAIATSSWAAGVATYTFATSPGFTAGHAVSVRGVTLHSGYNVDYIHISTVSVDGKTITLALAADSGGSGGAATGTMYSASVGFMAFCIEAITEGSSRDIVISGNHVTAGREHAIYFATGSPENVTVVGNVFEGQNRYGIYFGPGPGTGQPTNITIVGNTLGPGGEDDLDYVTYGIVMYAGKNVTIANNTMSYPTEEVGSEGIYFRGNVESVNITGNTIYNMFQGTAIAFEDLAPGDIKGVSITNNTIINGTYYAHGSSQETFAPITFACIDPATIIDGVTIAGNTLIDNQTTPTCFYAVRLQNTTCDVSNLMIGENYGTGFTSDSYYFVGSGWTADVAQWYLPTSPAILAATSNSFAGDVQFPSGSLGNYQNLITYSEQFDNAAWTKDGAGAEPDPTITANSTTAPNGTVTADTLVHNGSVGGVNTLSNTATALGAIGGRTFTGSMWVKGSGSTIGKAVHLRVGDGLNDTGEGETSDDFGSQVTLSSAWQRVAFTITFDGGNARTTVRLSMFGNYASIVVTDEWYIWGAELSESSYAKTYIPTTSAAVTASQGLVVTGGKVLSVNGYGTGNSVAATEVIGKAVVKKIEVFDATGTSIGYLPVYTSIT